MVSFFHATPRTRQSEGKEMQMAIFFALPLPLSKQLLGDGGHCEGAKQNEELAA